MKKQCIFFIFSIGLLLFASCNNVSTNIPVNEEELSLQLKSPLGKKTAKNVPTLKSELATFLLEVYGESKAFNITSVKVEDVLNGYVSYIDYETTDGYHGTVIKTNVKATETDQNLVVKKLNGRRKLLKSAKEENSAIVNGVMYTCRQLGDSPCIPSFEVSSTGAVSYSCGSSDCELIITVL